MVTLITSGQWRGMFQVTMTNGATVAFTTRQEAEQELIADAYQALSGHGHCHSYSEHDLNHWIG